MQPGLSPQPRSRHDRRSALRLSVGMVHTMRLACLPVLAMCLAAPALAQRVEPPAPAGTRTVEGFAPHRATYDLALKSSRWAANVGSLSGRMVSEFDDVCAGYTFNQRLVTNFTDSQGTAGSGNYWVSTYEAGDGSAYRFTLSNALSGQAVEKVEGAASREGAGGKASYDQPKRRKIDLPAGVVFPTESQGLAIAAARAGKRSLSMKVFEGDADGRVFDVYVAIGAPRSASEDELKVPGGEILKGVKGYPMTASFYPSGKGDDLPEYEASYTLFENGISTSVTFDYGEFAMSGSLRRIDAPAHPKC